MNSFLALLAFLTASGGHAEHVRIPGADGVTLDAALVRPAKAAHGSSVVALHGCGGPYPARDGTWAKELAARGHIVLLPDSFGSRGLGPQCRVKQRTVRAMHERRDDAIVAATWLAAQAGTPTGGIALLGWSHGGTTVLATARPSRIVPPGLFERFVAFYPGCAGMARDPKWQPGEPTLILIGEKDDWTPVAPCRVIADRYPDRIDLVTYVDAYHDFDAPDRPVQVLSGLATPADGRAHVGTNRAAREDALARVPAFLADRR